MASPEGGRSVGCRAILVYMWGGPRIKGLWIKTLVCKPRQYIVYLMREWSQLLVPMRQENTKYSGIQICVKREHSHPVWTHCSHWMRMLASFARIWTPQYFICVSSHWCIKFMGVQIFQLTEISQKQVESVMNSPYSPEWLAPFALSLKSLHLIVSLHWLNMQFTCTNNFTHVQCEYAVA